MDFGSESLKAYSDIPHIGDVVTLQEKDKISGLFTYLDKEITRRKQLFADYNGNYNDYIKSSGNKLPMIITFINNYDSFVENYENEIGGNLYLLIRDGYKYGIMFVVAATSPNAIRSVVLQYFSNLIALQLGDPFDYKFHLNAPSGLLPSKVFGRGLGVINESVYEYQTAYIYEKDKISEYIKEVKNLLNHRYPNIRARRIPQIPSKITDEALLKYSTDINRIPIGVDTNNISIFYQEFLKDKITQVSGNGIPTNTTFICGVINAINKAGSSLIELIDPTNYIGISEDEGNYYSSDLDEALDTVINNISDDSVNHFVIVNGVKDLLDNISDESKEKFYELLKNIKNSTNSCIILIEDYNSFKKLSLDDWYVENVKTNNGIWVGKNINSQILIEINNLLPEDANQEFEGLCYSINNGEYTVIKGIGNDYGE